MVELLRRSATLRLRSVTRSTSAMSQCLALGHGWISRSRTFLGSVATGDGRAARLGGRRRSGSRPRFARRATRRGPGSHTRQRGLPTRRCSRSGPDRAPSSDRNVTSVVSLCSSSHAAVRRQRPETTSCVRPASRSSIASAAAASTGFPSASPSTTTSVSTPSTGHSPPSTERAFPAASSTGSPPDSSNRGGTTWNGTPNCSRIARRCGETDARMSGGAGGTLTRACGPSRSPRPATCGPTRPTRSRSSRASPRSQGLQSPRAPRFRIPPSSSSRIHSPCGSWKSMPSSSPDHSIRCSPNCGRSNSVADLPRPDRLARTGRTVSSSAETRARRPAAAAEQPRESTDTDRTRSTRRTPTAQDRTTRPGSGTSSAFASISSIANAESPRCIAAPSRAERA